MNLEELFKIQAELDKRIVEKHGLQNEDLLDKKILALQVELGELANEWRGFKFWSEDQKARTETQCHACEGKGFFDFTTPFSNEHFTEECEYCGGTGIQENKNPLRSEEHTSELQSRGHLVCRLLLEKKKTIKSTT